MREFQEKKSWKRFLYSRMTAVLLLVAIVVLARAVWGLYQKERESAANALTANTELQKLEDRRSMLESELSKLETDEGIEEEIRQKYSVSKPGENVVIIVDKNATSAPVQAPEEGWWTKFKKFLR
jgi:cell division protein FtsB